MKAVSAGIDNLTKSDDFAKQQVMDTCKVGGGGVDSGPIKWKVGEMEFEAYMRLLDSMVRILKGTSLNRVHSKAMFDHRCLHVGLVVSHLCRDGRCNARNNRPTVLHVPLTIKLSQKQWPRRKDWSSCQKRCTGHMCYYFNKKHSYL